MDRSLKLIASQPNMSSRVNECSSKNKMEVGETAQWIRVNIDLTEDLSSIPGPHTRQLPDA